jgi:TM2 domain-containing membrane protein YozV
MKNKTLATWLALVLGSMGAHRFYLRGFADPWAWAMIPITSLGLLGVWRARHFGVDDVASWVLAPLLGLMIAVSCLSALVYGLSPRERWNARYNATAGPEHQAGATNWFTVLALVAALMIGATSFLGSLAYSFQRYFEVQIEEARKISQ